MKRYIIHIKLEVETKEVAGREQITRKETEPPPK